MRPGFLLGEVGNGLRRNVSMVVSVVLVTMVSLFFLGIGLLAQLVEADRGGAALALFAAAAASRGAMAWLWSALPSADIGGLADRMGRPTAAVGRRALLLGDGLFLVLGALAFGILPAFAGLALGGIVLLWFRGVIRRRLGGQSGDCLGAVQQLAEAVIYLAVLATLGHGALG